MFMNLFDFPFCCKFSLFTLILIFFRAETMVMLLKKDFIMAKNLNFSLKNKKFK
jgi:hypothetical protein